MTISAASESRCSPRLGAEVVEDDVAVGVAGDDHDLEPRHRRARRIGAVGDLPGSGRRCARLSPRSRWYARIAISPANSPCAPEFGCSDTAAKPVIWQSACSSSVNTW